MPARLLTSRALALRAAAAAMLSLALAGCQSVAGTSATSAGVRFVDASPDAPGLDFLINKIVQVYNFGYTSFTQNYLGLAAGNYTVAAAASGNDAQPVASTGLGVKNGTRYTVIAGNIYAGLQLTPYTDLSGPAPAGNVSIRIIDQSTATGAVDIYLIPDGGKLITTNPLYTALTFTATTGYINVPAGTYTMAVVPNGTVPIATTLTSYTGPSITYAAGSARTFVLYDQKITTTQPLNVITLNDYE